MRNQAKEDECMRMLFVSGLLDKLANYGESEVLTTEVKLSFLTSVLDSFGMEYRVEETGEEVSADMKAQPEVWKYYRILMKDSMWGDWATPAEGVDTK